jgi:hypothetical protein
MLEIEVGDIVQMYKHSIITYKNKPVYVVDVARDGEVEIFDISTQRGSFVPFSLKEFKPLNRRLGFVNSRGSAVYVARLPVRKYKVGISQENVKVSTLNAYYPQGKPETRDHVKQLRSPEVYDALMDKYPSFKEALAYVRKREGAMAFDKQFAVDTEGSVFYKTSIVGTIKRDKDRIEDIKFIEGKEHLIHFIGNSYVKNLRAA